MVKSVISNFIPQVLFGNQKLKERKKRKLKKKVPPGFTEKECLKKREKPLIGVWGEAWGVLLCAGAVLGLDSKFLGLSAAVPVVLTQLCSRTSCAVKSSLKVLLGVTIPVLQKSFCKFN